MKIDICVVILIEYLCIDFVENLKTLRILEGGCPLGKHHMKVLIPSSTVLRAPPYRLFRISWIFVLSFLSKTTC